MTKFILIDITAMIMTTAIDEGDWDDIDGD